jgi:hypothetical protein
MIKTKKRLRLTLIKILQLKPILWTELRCTRRMEKDQLSLLNFALKMQL